MSTFDVTLSNGTVERVVGADAYDLDGPLTTFFTSASAKETLDAWSTRLASFRSADVLMVRRVLGQEHEQDNPPRLQVVS